MTETIQWFNVEDFQKVREFQKEATGELNGEKFGEQFLTPYEWNKLPKTLRLRTNEVNSLSNNALEKRFGEKSLSYRYDSENVYKDKLRDLFDIK